MFSVELFQSNLKTKLIGKKIIYYASTKSTNSDVWDLYHKGENEGLVVIANDQTKGRGRGKKKWITTKELGLACSILIKQKFNLEKNGLHAILIPIGIILGIKNMYDIPISIKWPNDLYYENKKLGGVLIESKYNSSNSIYNIGFGINVNESINDFPKNIKNYSTSLKIVTGEKIQRELLLANILNCIDKNLCDIKESFIIKEWMKYCNHINSEILIKQNGGKIKGIFKKINQRGQAIINKNGQNIIFDGPILNI